MYSLLKNDVQSSLDKESKLQFKELEKILESKKENNYKTKY